jgi:hypothetical protein
MYATREQIIAMKNRLTVNDLYGSHYDRLWKIIGAHETDVLTPGAGTRMLYDMAEKTIAWLDRQIRDQKFYRQATAGRSNDKTSASLS